MTTALLFALVGILLALAVALALGFRRFAAHQVGMDVEYAAVRREFVTAQLTQLEAPATDRLLAERLRDRFIVTTTSGESFDGLLMEVDDRSIVLADVFVFAQDGKKVPTDGEVVLRRDAIAHMQRP